MTSDELVEELHELRRRNETPIPLIDMFDALLSRPEADRKTAAQEILRDHGCGVGAAGTQGRLTIYHRTTFKGCVNVGGFWGGSAKILGATFVPLSPIRYCARVD